MHTTCGVTEGIWFNHNGDFSGSVMVVISDDAEWPYKDGPAGKRYEGADDPNATVSRTGYWSFRIPFEDLRALVATYVRNKQIAAVEEATDEEVILNVWHVTMDGDEP